MILSLCLSVYPSVSFTSTLLTESREPEHMFHPVGSKATVCAFTYTPNLVLTGHESGKVALFDVTSGTEVANNERAHMDTVTDLQLAPDRSYFLTSSKDKTARVRISVSFSSYRCSSAKSLGRYMIPKLCGYSKRIPQRHRSTARHWHQTDPT